jgi:type I restriction enzyme S subunit
MIADLKPYPEYKESGLPWLGQVPRHWTVKRAKAIFQRIDERSKTGKEELLTVSSARGIVPRKSASVTMFKAESYLGYKLCWPGDLVINSLWAWAGGLGVSRHHGIISSAYGVYRIRHDARMTSAFVHEVVRSSPFNWELRVRSKGVWISRLQLTDISFLDAPMHIPPAGEQAAIVRFLDWANGRLERAIQAKRKVIALLNEQKQAIIHRAVTRGLDPTIPLKPSGIPWLGDIPVHWQVRRLKHCITPIEQGWSPQCDAQPAADNEWGVLKVGCVNKDSFAPQQNKKLPASLQPDHSLAIRDGDVLVSRANTRELLWLAAFAENPPAKRILCDKLFRFRAKSDCFNSKFLVLALRTKPCRVQIESSTNGASDSMQNIGQGVLKNLWVSMPAVAEQDKIVTYIAVATQPVSAALSRLEREIELLREYRTRLVTDVVTGHVDVREAAARLPEEALPDTAEDATNLGDETEPADEETAV